MNETSQKLTEFKPNEQQIIFVKALISMEVMGNLTKAGEVSGVNRENWYLWLDRPGFVEWYNKERKKLRKTLYHDYILGFGKGLRKGDPQVLKYYGELEDDYVPKTKTEVKGEVGVRHYTAEEKQAGYDLVKRLTEAEAERQRERKLKLT